MCGLETKIFMSRKSAKRHEPSFSNSACRRPAQTADTAGS